jgi:hypothetical protein
MMAAFEVPSGTIPAKNRKLPHWRFMIEQPWLSGVGVGASER